MLHCQSKYHEDGKMSGRHSPSSLAKHADPLTQIDIGHKDPPTHHSWSRFAFTSYCLLRKLSLRYLGATSPAQKPSIGIILPLTITCLDFSFYDRGWQSALAKLDSTRKVPLSIMAVQWSFDTLPYDVFYHLIPYCDIEDAFALTRVNKMLRKALWTEQYAAQVMKVTISIVN